MAILSKTGITTGQTVEPGHVTQSIDAFTGIEAYDIFLSGSFNMTGSINGEPGVINSLTSSYAVTASNAITASYALNAGASFPYTGSAAISGSLTVDGNISGSLILGTTRTTKEYNRLDNDPQISSTLATLGIYAGSITSINLRSSNTNFIRLSLPLLSNSQFGDRYEFIISENAASGGTALFRLNCATGDRMYGSVIGADGGSLYSTGSLYISTGDGNGRVGDRIMVTSVIGLDSNRYWAVEAIVSGSAGYLFV